MIPNSPSLETVQPRDFLEHLFTNLGGGFIEVRALTKQEGFKPRRRFYSSVETLMNDWGWITQINATHGVYFGVCPRSKKCGKKSAVKLVLVLWVDLDGDPQTIFSRLKTFPLPPSIIVESGHGVHAYWILREPSEACPEIEHVLKGLNRALNGDPKTCELARVMRLPGTMNVKDPAHAVPCRVIEWHPERQYNLSDFDQFLDESATVALLTEPPKDVTVVRKFQTPSIEKPCAQSYESSGVPERHRNSVGYFLATEWHRLSILYDQALQRMATWNARNQPPVPSEEYEEILRKPTEKAYYESKKPYGCNHLLLKARCVGKYHCPYYQTLMQPITFTVPNHEEAVFDRYGWSKRLPALAVDTYRRIIALERQNEVTPGGTLLTSHRILAKGISSHPLPEEVRRAVLLLQRHGLVTYEPGDSFIGGRGSVICRVLPIPPSPKNIKILLKNRTLNPNQHILGHNGKVVPFGYVTPSTQIPMGMSQVKSVGEVR